MANDSWEKEYLITASDGSGLADVDNDISATSVEFVPYLRGYKL